MAKQDENNGYYDGCIPPDESDDENKAPTVKKKFNFKDLPWIIPIILFVVIIIVYNCFYLANDFFGIAKTIGKGNIFYGGIITVLSIYGAAQLLRALFDLLDEEYNSKTKYAKLKVFLTVIGCIAFLIAVHNAP